MCETAANSSEAIKTTTKTHKLSLSPEKLSKKTTKI